METTYTCRFNIILIRASDIEVFNDDNIINFRDFMFIFIRFVLNYYRYIANLMFNIDSELLILLY